ncbi:hypothetical protein KRP22_005455 [Phytophthora ramorum]|nr:hypothetical protein KRP22_3414 [Phytophthora ramorum]
MASLRASKYARYKRVTTFFLNWVLNARGRGRDTGQKVERKAMFFAADDEGQHSHQHFLSLLRGWLATLKGVEVQQQRVERESYYEVLELDEEYFPAFAEDLRLKVVYFFLELEELVEGVFEIYDQAKNEERTMVEATVAVKVAMDAASALTVSLQLKYPALKMAADVGFVLLNNFPGNFWRRANEAVVDFWKSFATDGTYKFVRSNAQKQLCGLSEVYQLMVGNDNAAIAGHEDIVRIILEADNMIDLNTPTFHSKETLVHLTVKNNHRSMFYQLCSFGADIYIKDGNERRVCDVTTDRKWVRELKDFIAEIEQSRTKRDSSKNRDAILRHESMLHAERLRQSVTSQRDDERRLALENTGASGSAKTKS